MKNSSEGSKSRSGHKSSSSRSSQKGRKGGQRGKDNSQNELMPEELETEEDMSQINTSS